MSVQYITDENGRRVSVVLPIEEYERLIEALEDADDVRLYDEAKAELARGEDEAIPWEQAKKEIEEERAELRRQGLV
jgi:hypothetical protein